jgi:hypothetical protein
VSVYGCSNCGRDTENEPLVLCDECNSEPDVSPDGLRAQLSETLEDLKELRLDRDSMKTWVQDILASSARQRAEIRRLRAAMRDAAEVSPDAPTSPRAILLFALRRKP